MLVGCSAERKEDNIHGPTRVQLPFAVDGKYGLYVLELQSLKNLENLEGSAARFLMDPGVMNNRLHGLAPTIRYMRNTNGVVIPKDDLSLQLLTVYAHIERLQQLDQATGAGGVLSYPRTVAVNAEYRSDEGHLENNALYAGQYDALLFVPYTQSALPIMANGGIIGHEHFHALFHKMVIQPLGKAFPDYQGSGTDSKPGRAGLTAVGDVQRIDGEAATAEENRRRYHSLVFRGLNEGLADVWGWVYSGDTQFVGQSLPQEKITRDLNSPPEILDSQAALKHWVEKSKPGTLMVGTAYNLGSQVARAIKGFASLHNGKNSDEVSTSEQRLELGKILLKVLPELKIRFQELKTDEYMNPSVVLQIFADQVPNLSKDGCEYLRNLIPLQEQKQDRNIDGKCAALP